MTRIHHSPGPGQSSLEFVARRHSGEFATECVEHVAAEVPIEVSFNHRPFAVMLASPRDLVDFTYGFALTEDVVGAPDDIATVNIHQSGSNVQINAIIPEAWARRLSARQRMLAGRSGCGLCGAARIEHVLRPAPRAETNLHIPPKALFRAVEGLPEHQEQNRALGSLHAAAFACRDGTILCVREDVGRHNALDKLIGAMFRAGMSPRTGFILVSSRCSYEMVHKTAIAGCGIVAALSAPTSMAIELAERKGIGLAAFAREGRFTVYAGQDRFQSNSLGET